MNNKPKVTLQKAIVIGRIPLFSELSNNDIELIASNSEIVEYKKDDFIYKEGDPPSAFFAIISGRVKIYITHKKRIETVEYLHRGSYFGIISLLTGDRHSVTAKVVNDALMLQIKKDKFDEILKAIPKLAVYFSSMLSRRIKKKDFGPKAIFESTIISIYGVSRNIGRTLYAINLAASLIKETQKKVLFLDMASNAESLTKFLKLQKKLVPFPVKNLFFNESSVKKNIVEHDSGIHFLDISNSSGVANDTNRIGSLLGYLTNEYHYVIVDLPVEIDDAILKTITQSDLIHIITDIKEDNAILTNKIVKSLRQVVNNAEDKITVVVNEIKGKIDNFDAFSYKVYATLPNISKDIYAKSQTELFVLNIPECGYAKAIRRISRSIGGVLVGLVLGAGAALGLSHIGVIKVLEKEGISVDVVVGSSMGALIAALWAIGNNADQLEKVALASRKRVSLFSLSDIIIPLKGLISDTRTMKLLNAYFGDKTFKDVKMPLKIVAAGFENRRVVVIDSGRLTDAVRASIAIPGIFTPQKRGNMHLIDGGILEPVPVSVLMRMGVKRIIAVNVLPSPSDTQRHFDMQSKASEREEEKMKKVNILSRSVWKIKKKVRSVFTPSILDIIVGSMQSMQYSMAEHSCRQADVYIHPDTVGLHWADFFNVHKAVKRGEKAAEAELAEIKDAIPEGQIILTDIS